MNHLFKVIDDTYGFIVYLYIGSDKAELRKKVAKEKFWEMNNFDEYMASIDDNSFSGITTTLNYNGAAPMYFVYIPIHDDENELYITLCHELGHVAHRSLVYRGWSDFANEDVFHSYLYLHDSLVRKSITYIKEQKKKSKKSKKK